jgi:putative aldouronate transport system permease protein
MHFSASLRKNAFPLINGFFLALFGLICAYPIYYIIIGSISDPISMMKHTGFLFRPYNTNLTAYKTVFDNRMIPLGYFNTLIYLSLGLIVNMSFTSLGAYALSKKSMMLRNPIMLVVSFTMFFSGGMIPTYLLVYKLGMIDHWTAMVFPSAINTFNLIIMRTAFQEIPEELFESIRIDGGTEWHNFFRIALPLSPAVIAVIALYYGVYHWNSWMPAMLYLRTRSLYPLQLVLREILINNDLTSMGVASSNAADIEYIGVTIKYATIIVAALPIMCVYPFLQRFFMKGVMIGAIKG